MFNSLRDELETTVAPMLREILDDARKLAQQEVQLVRLEAREEGIKLRRALFFLSVGTTFGVIALMLAAFMLVQFVASDWLSLPLWQAFGLVALALLLLGGITSYLGARILRDVRDSSSRSVKALKEGVEWMRQVM
ncbi:MAG: phage holin family protein [Pseudomonadota bacterium]|jgi:uncharacterized membrane protein YqjE